jgi:glutamine phosphoribosylpyrophosphate amidotransferase
MLPAVTGHLPVPAVLLVQDSPGLRHLVVLVTGSLVGAWLVAKLASILMKVPGQGFRELKPSEVVVDMVDSIVLL